MSLNVNTLTAIMTGIMSIIASVFGSQFLKANKKLKQTIMFIDSVQSTLNLVNESLTDDKITDEEVEKIKVKLVALQKEAEELIKI